MEKSHHSTSTERFRGLYFGVLSEPFKRGGTPHTSSEDRLEAEEATLTRFSEQTSLRHSEEEDLTDRQRVAFPTDDLRSHSRQSHRTRYRRRLGQDLLKTWQEGN